MFVNLRFQSRRLYRSNLIDWHSVTPPTEPPLTVTISDNEHKAMILDVPAEIDILRFPCHSQAVERCVKLVTEASAAVCGTTHEIDS